MQMVCEPCRKQNNRRGKVFASASLEVLMRTVFMLVQEQHWSEGEKIRDILTKTCLELMS